MNTANPDRKESILKTLAIAGLLGIAVLVAWLAVQIVQIFPAALSSLVGMANSVYNYNPLKTSELTLTQSDTTVTAGDPFTVSWEKQNASGTYVFNFDCREGTTLDLSADSKDFVDLNCNEQYDLGAVDTITLSAHTKDNQFTDLTYSVSFYRPNSHTPAASQSSTVTIVNASGALATDTPTEDTPSAPILEPEPHEEVVTPVVVSEESGPETKPSTKPAPTTTEGTSPTPVFTYSIPVSDPRGVTDLVVSFLGVGRVTTTGVFIPTHTLKQGEAGALQFAVHNIGTKTSSTWSYETVLPSTNTYVSDSEKALLPNERAVFTLSFPTLDTKESLATIRVTLKTDDDINVNNNFVASTILVTK